MKGLAFSALVLLAGVLALCEAALRLCWTPPRFHNIHPGNDPIYHHIVRSRELLATQDAQGAPITARQSAEEFRVFVIGDSFIHGVGSADGPARTITAYLEKALRVRRPDRKFTVFNLGCPSYSPIIYYLVLQRQALINDPDLVVIAYDDSDPADDSLYTTLATFDADGRPTAVVPEPDYESLELKLEMIWPVLRRVIHNGGRWETYVQQRRNRLGHRRDPWDKWREAFALSTKYLGFCVDLCAASRTPTMLTHLPQVYALEGGEGEEKLRRRWGFPPTGALRDVNLDRALSEFARRREIPCLDLEPYAAAVFGRYLESGGKLDELYQLPNDDHPTELAHKLIAPPIAAFIDEHFLSPQAEK